MKRADKVVLVLCQTYGEFKKWCRDSNKMPGVDAIFIDKPHKAEGRDPLYARIKKLPSFSRMKDISEFAWILERFRE